MESKEHHNLSAIRDTKLIIKDEASMCLAQIAECVDRLLQDVTGNRVPFGGKCVVFAGYFRQKLPVVANSDPSRYVNQSIILSICGVM